MASNMLYVVLRATLFLIMVAVMHRDSVLVVTCAIPILWGAFFLYLWKLKQLKERQEQNRLLMQVARMEQQAEIIQALREMQFLTKELQDLKKLNADEEKEEEEEKKKKQD